MIGSAYIFQDVLRTRKQRGDSVYHRLMMGMSTFDFMASLMNFLSTWPTPTTVEPPVWLAAGTTGTCTAQGFFNELGNICTPVYNATLSIYYVLIIRSGWNERRLCRYEAWFQMVPLVFGFGISLAALGFKNFNNSGWNCWLANYPKGCSESGLDGDTTCTRGGHAIVFRWAHFAIIWSAILVSCMSMGLIWSVVYRQEKATEHLTKHRTVAVSHGYATHNTINHNITSNEGHRRPSAGPPPDLKVLAADDQSQSYASNPAPSGRRESFVKLQPRVRSKTPTKTTKARKVMIQAAYFCGAMVLTWIFTTVSLVT
jgi:hypothetical protein